MNDRREFLKGFTGLSLSCALPPSAGAASVETAQIAITYDLEISRHYPKRGNTEWDYQKGNLDQDTKRYSVEAAKMGDVDWYLSVVPFAFRVAFCFERRRLVFRARCALAPDCGKCA